MVDSIQSSKGASTFEKSFQDNGSNFGYYQLWWFVLSILGLSLYFIHYICSVMVARSLLSFSYDFPLLHRTTADAILELLVLVGRGGNELYFGKWSGGDVVHHVGVFLGIYLVFYNEQCRPFAWLVCQLNTLHFPMFIWYFGCRKNCFSTSLSVQKLFKSIFPPLWLAVSSYRLSCLVFSTMWAWWAEGNITAGISGLIFALVLGYLDKNWTEFFLQELSIDTIKSKGIVWDFKDINVMYSMGIIFGFMTVFCF